MQFSLGTVFLVFVVIWSSMVAFGVGGIILVALLAFVAFAFRHRKNRICFIVILGFLFFWGSMSFHVDPCPSWLICQSNLKYLQRALLNYHEDFGQFPPAFITDAEGHPMHSWRVLLLPYLEEQYVTELYKQYRFDEPWDSPNNQKLAAELTHIFQCPGSEELETRFPLATNYVAVIGPGTAWPGSKGSRMKEFRDGTNRTVMLVEISKSDINWMEPRDITLEEAIANKPYQVPSSNHCVPRSYFFTSTYYLNGGNATLADGSEFRVFFGISRDHLAALLSIDGGEELDPETLHYRYPNDSCKPHPDNNFGLSRLVSYFIFVISMTMLVSRPIFGRS